MSTEHAEVQIQNLIDEAKANKAALDMAKLDYRHSMKKLSILADQFPALALKYGLTKAKIESDKAESA